MTIVGLGLTIGFINWSLVGAVAAVPPADFAAGMFEPLDIGRFDNDLIGCKTFVVGWVDCDVVVIVVVCGGRIIDRIEPEQHKTQQKQNGQSEEEETQEKTGQVQ